MFCNELKKQSLKFLNLHLIATFYRYILISSSSAKKIV